MWPDSYFVYVACFRVFCSLARPPKQETVQAVNCAIFVSFAASPAVLAGGRPELYSEISHGFALVTGKALGGEESGSEYGYEYEYEDEEGDPADGKNSSSSPSGKKGGGKLKP
eukprot:COSAG05_NODE_1277_length_5304_cov_5.087992_2_plen_113_part_00